MENSDRKFISEPIAMVFVSTNHSAREKLAPAPVARGVPLPTFAVRETDVSQHNGSASGVPLNPSETIVF